MYNKAEKRSGTWDAAGRQREADMNREITMVDWCISRQYGEKAIIQGIVYGHPKHRDGSAVHTTHIVGIRYRGDTLFVETFSGSHYRLTLSEIAPLSAIVSYECVRKWQPGEGMRRRWSPYIKRQEEVGAIPLEDRQTLFLERLESYLKEESVYAQSDGDKHIREKLIPMMDRLAREQCIGNWYWKTADYWKRILRLLREHGELAVRVMLPKFMEEYHNGYLSDWEDWQEIVQTEFPILCGENRELYRIWYETIFWDWMDMCTKGGGRGKNPIEDYRLLIAQKRPQWYTDEDFFQMVQKQENRDDSCIWLLWMKRALGRKLKVDRQGEYSGAYLHDFLTGRWKRGDEEEEEEESVQVMTAMVMESVEVVGEYAPVTLEEGIPREEYEVLDTDDLELFVLCCKNGMLRERYADQYMQYAFEHKKLALIPGIIAMKHKIL